VIAAESRPTPAWARHLRGPWAAPLIAFAATQLLLLVVMRYGGFSFLNSKSYERWDASIYLDIARYGYHDPCSPGHPAVCGNGGWFPLYPALLHPFRVVGIEVGPAGVAVSALLSFAFLAVVWNGLLRRRVSVPSLLALVAAAFSPGMIYQHAIFPLGLTATGLAVALWMLRERRWVLAGLGGAVAAASYPAAGLIGPLAAVWILFLDPTPGSARERVRRAALTAVPAVAGTLLVFLYAQLRTGHWDLYFDVQAAFHHGLHEPFSAMVHAATPRVSGLGGVGLFVAFQEWLVAALVVLVLAVVWRARAARDPFDRLLALYAVVLWILPFSQANVADYRTAALLAPLTLVVARAPRAVGAAYAAASVVVAAGIALAYFQSFLV
jgi:hypothetical protein